MEPRKVECTNKECKYAWIYKGQNPFYACCPRCKKRISLKEPIKVKCSNKECGHTWIHKGRNKFYANCPRCLRKVDLGNFKDEDWLVNNLHPLHYHYFLNIWLRNGSVSSIGFGCELSQRQQHILVTEFLDEYPTLKSIPEKEIAKLKKSYEKFPNYFEKLIKEWEEDEN